MAGSGGPPSDVEGRKRTEEAGERQAATYAARGDEAWARKDAEGAARCYGRALRHRATAKLLLRRARANSRMKKHHEVEQDCHKALVLERGCPEAMVLLAKAKREMGRIDEAHQDISEATKRQPGNLEAKQEAQRVKKAIEQRDRKEILMREAKQGGRVELVQVLEACETMKKIRESDEKTMGGAQSTKNCVQKVEESMKDCKDAQDLFRFMGGVELLAYFLPEDNMSVLKALFQACSRNMATSRVIVRDNHLKIIVPLVSDRRAAVVQLVLKILEEVASVGALRLGQALQDAGHLRTLCLIGQRAPNALHASSLSILAEMAKSGSTVLNGALPFADALVGGAIRGCCSSSRSTVKDALTVLQFCSQTADFKDCMRAEYSLPGSSKKAVLDTVLGLVESLSEEASELETEILPNGIEVVKRDYVEAGVDQVCLLVMAIKTVWQVLSRIPDKVSQLKNVGTVAMLLPMLTCSPSNLSSVLAHLFVTCCEQDIDFAYLIGDLGGSSAVYSLCIEDYSHRSAVYFSLLNYLALSKTFQEYMKSTKNAEFLAGLLSVHMKDDSTTALAETILKVCRYDADFFHWMCCQHNVLATLVRLWYSHAGGAKKAVQALLSLVLESEATSNTLVEEFEEGQLMRLLHDLRAHNMAEQMKATGGASSQLAGARGEYQLSQQEQEVDEASHKINLSKLGAYIKTLTQKDQWKDFVFAEYASSTAVVGRSLAAWLAESYSYLLLRKPALVPVVQRQLDSSIAGRIRVVECSNIDHGFGNVPSHIDVLLCVQVWSMLSTSEKERLFSSIACKLHNDGKVIIIEDDINVVGQISRQATTAGFIEYAEPEISAEHFTKVFFLP